MSKTKITQKVIDKLKINVPSLATKIKTTKPSERINLIKKFKEELALTDQQYAKVLTSLIKSYQILSSEGTEEEKENFKKELKNITHKPPVSIFFKYNY